jgi:hypothetical protein
MGSRKAPRLFLVLLLRRTKQIPRRADGARATSTCSSAEALDAFNHPNLTYTLLPWDAAASLLPATPEVA